MTNDEGKELYIDPTTKLETTPPDSLFSGIIKRSFEIGYRDKANKTENIGLVTLYTTQSVVMNEVKTGFIMIIVNAIIKTVSLWIFFLWAGFVYLSRPLGALTTATARIAAGEFNDAKVDYLFKETGGTEVDTLALSFNVMTEKLISSTQELSQTQSRLQGMINAMPSILIGVTDEGIVTDWNEQAAKATGKSYKDVVGKKLSAVYPQFAVHMLKVRLALEHNTLQKDSRIMEVKNEERRFFDVLVYPVICFPFLGAVIRIDDVTSQVKVEEIMMQTEKMTSIGNLAAGIAHEINNPLGSILQGAQNITRRVDPSLAENNRVAEELGIDVVKIQQYMEKRKIIEFLQGVREAGERAAKIVSNLLKFSRKTTSEKAIASFNDVVEQALLLVKTDYSLKKQMDFKRIKIEKSYDAEVPPIYCCMMEIEQVVLNLLKNAAQAMASQTRPQAIHLSLSKKGEMVQLIIADTGPGMDEKVCKRIFEPFFTTKPPGEGTGLGLSVSYGIIENHQGTLEVTSKIDEGTQFIICLPIYNPNAQVAQTNPPDTPAV